jgi:5-methylcytosine-specific restriction enzyme A
VSSLRGIKRMEFPLSVRKKAFVRCCHDGVPHCEGCVIEINAQTGIIHEHVISAGLGGEPTPDNAKVHCKTCADIKTETEDKPRMAKADRVLEAHHGLKKKGRPMPGSKASGLKKRMDGTVVRR